MAHPAPLSWREARQQLRACLSEYLDTHSQEHLLHFHNASTGQNQKATTATQRMGNFLHASVNKWNLDLLVGSVGCSIFLLVVTIVFQLDDEAVHQRQISGAVALVVGSFCSLWLYWRRGLAHDIGNDILKRRAILQFLRAMEQQQEEAVSMENIVPTIDLAGTGTSLTGIYPVYRTHDMETVANSDSNKPRTPSKGSWIRIPALLIVRGDYVALQVGDVAPAHCRLIGGTATISNGQRLSTNDIAAPILPRGKTTLLEGSDDLLALCNRKRIFVVQRTPIKDFLQQPRVAHRKPQVLRQLEGARVALFCVALLIFLFSFLILGIRAALTSIHMSSFLSLPFLAALSVLPMSGSIYLVFGEIIGTARILVSYHPAASARDDSFAKKTATLRRPLLRYVVATTMNRLSLQDFLDCLQRLFSNGGEIAPPDLVRIPPASINVLEKLGVATAFCLVDDELACEPSAIPQQLLIPSRKGLKLLDICPSYDDDSEAQSDSGQNGQHRRSFDVNEDHDSDSESDTEYQALSVMPRNQRAFRRKKVGASERLQLLQKLRGDRTGVEELDFQFEDPLWWQHLPSLKCIGLACLSIDEKDVNPRQSLPSATPTPGQADVLECKRLLCNLVCAERKSSQLKALAQCIGFNTAEKSVNKQRGDLAPFVEQFRLHVVSAALLKERLEIDFHERSSEGSRWWGRLRSDSTSVIVKDKRSGAFQLLTIGDPRVVVPMCHEAWQGESSTILPLSATDRATVLETGNNWKLADLDVAAFSYSPIPHTFEARYKAAGGKKAKFYLFDNTSELAPSSERGRSAMNGEWQLLQNQIFLGILGSLVVPRQEIQGLLSTLQDAGVRFVYFSPRNMRRQKEIASQMGIDVAWNCAISLRPLVAGEEDPHRMTSAYADWDVNAKLPHGIQNVRKHLEDVDNVPLLVSLFTDATKESTGEMIELFQQYNDTVISVGLSHIPWNSPIFSTADLSVGVDVITDCIPSPFPSQLQYNALLPSEVAFVASISAHRCAFQLKGESSAAFMPVIIAQGRASLDAVLSGALFLLSGLLSFVYYIFFSACSVSTSIPLVPTVGSSLYLLVFLPGLSLSMTLTDPEESSMQNVPPKNDVTAAFGRNERFLLARAMLLKGIGPALLSHLIYLIAYGEFVIYSDPEGLASECSSSIQQGEWPKIIRCSGINNLDLDDARAAAGSLALGVMMLCVISTSSAFVYRARPMIEELPWRRNLFWVLASFMSFVLVVAYLAATVEIGNFSALPWYSFVLIILSPCICLACAEQLKKWEVNYYTRAEKLRRLQFETRLGMWSPK